MLDPIAIPPGYGMRVLHSKERDALEDLEDHLLIWESPRKACQYVVPVDVADGIGLDRSVIDVIRVGTVTEPDEQVAQFVSTKIDPIDLAYYVDAIGHLYADRDGFEALAAVETNNHGIATQAELQRHCGYGHFFIWQVEDGAPGTSPYTRRVGWYTSSRTRPIIITRLVKAIKTIDPITNVPDFRVNSPHTMAELADFVVPPGGLIGDACAATGAYDDCLMAAAIGVHVAQTLHFEQREPLSETRRRLSVERLRAQANTLAQGQPREPRNTDMTLEELYGTDGDRDWRA